MLLLRKDFASGDMALLVLEVFEAKMLQMMTRAHDLSTVPPRDPVVCIVSAKYLQALSGFNLNSLIGSLFFTKSRRLF